MSSRRGRRYDDEPHLNYKKVIAVILVLLVIVMIIFMIKRILAKGKEAGRITSASYYALYTDNKWGIIDNTGKEVISPSYQEMIKVPNNKKDVFLCTYDINNETGEYKTKALNSKNEEIFTEYSKIEAIENVDKNNNLWYEENVLKVEKDGKYGLIDLTGKQVLPCEYENITVVAGIKNSIKVQKDGKYGLVTTEGTTVLETIYKDILGIEDDYKNGYIVIGTDGKYGVVDYLGKQLLEAKYEKVEPIYGKESYVITEAGKQKLINAAGETLVEGEYDSIKQILGYTTQGIIFKKDNKFGVMNTKKETLINNEYDDLKEAKDQIFIAKKGEKYGIINLQNEAKVDFNYKSISYDTTADLFFAEDEEFKSSIIDSSFEVKLQGIVSEINDEKGYFKIRKDNEYKYYNFKFEEKDAKDILSTNTLFLSKQDGKYGFVNNKGEVIVDYIYDDATEQNDAGYAAVKKDGKWGSIDVNGKVVIEPTYNLENNYLIDFVGKWHLGQDVNMNYYCDK
ncbi:MAG: WG repeat-containing protein [Clostridia bacterium]|nr:WG repeat-containing protein [Clostridia bacterium]